MKSLPARIVGWIEAFLIKAPPLWVGLGMIVLGVAGFEGMVTYNQSNAFCFKCHEQEGLFRSIDLESTAHTPVKKENQHCLTCHTDKDFYTYAVDLARSASKGLVVATNDEIAHLPPQDPGYDDADCLKCHYDVLKIEKADALDLPPELAQIGLNFSHRNHFRVKDFPAEAATRLMELNMRTGLSKVEIDERDLLLRAQLGRGGQCHDREQIQTDGEGAPDRSINYFSLNPMRCTGCHLDAARDNHPGTVRLELPREETCRRCHTGTFHGRYTIFRAECAGTDTRDCRRCHPLWRAPGKANVAAAAAIQP